MITNYTYKPLFYIRDVGVALISVQRQKVICSNTANPGDLAPFT